MTERRTGGRSTAIEYEMRLLEAEQLLAATGSPRKASLLLVERFRTTDRPITRQTAFGWCRIVRERQLEEQAERDGRSRKEVVASLLEQVHQCLAMAYADRNVKAALEAIRTIAALQGVNLARIEVSGPGGGPVQVQDMTREERRKRIAELEQKVRGGVTAD